jgi:putative nucleotidyltransferase with HDIG domain
MPQIVSGKNYLIPFIQWLMHGSKVIYIRGHSERVTVLSIMIGKLLNLSAKELNLLRVGALLHDLGKIGIYDTVLNKKDNLTPSEFSLIKQHPVIGAQIVRPIGLPEAVYNIILQI